MKVILLCQCLACGGNRNNSSVSATLYYNYTHIYNKNATLSADFCGFLAAYVAVFAYHPFADLANFVASTKMIELDPLPCRLPRALRYIDRLQVVIPLERGCVLIHEMPIARPCQVMLAFLEACIEALDGNFYAKLNVPDIIVPHCCLVESS